MSRRAYAAAAPLPAAALVAALMAGGAPLRAQPRSAPEPPAAFPAAPPAPGPIKAAAFPPFQEATLANGLRVVLVENHRDPVVAFRVAVPAGDAYAPAGKEGLSGLEATLLTRGAGSRTAEQVAATIEGAGGSLSAGSGPDFLTLYGSALSANAGLAMQLAGDALARPTFAEQEVELARQQLLSGLQLEQSQPNAIARRAFNAALYGSNPYGRAPTPASVRAVTRADLVAYQQARLRPQGALLVVAGDITMPQLRTLAEQSFGGWTGTPAAAPALSAPPAHTGRQILLVNRPGSVQANVVVGNLTTGPADPTRYAATVANKLLGGGADARLFDVLREKKGYTYGAYSNLTRPRGVGAFTATVEARNEVADSALVELLAQLRRVDAEPVPAPELANAKNALVGSFPLTVETAPQIAEQVAEVKLLGLPENYLQTYRPRIAAVSAADLEQAARRYVRPEDALVVVVGDGAKLYDRLAKIGPVRVVDPLGNAVAAASLTAPAGPVAALPLDLPRLAARRASFVVRVGGNPLGYSVASAARGGDGWTFTDNTLIAGGAFRQTDTLAVDARLAPQSLAQSTARAGQSGTTRLTYRSGRVTGTAARPTPAGFETSPVDAPVPTGAVDENGMLALVAAMPWAAGTTQAVTAFSAGQNALVPLTLTATGPESVTVPAGTFQAFRVEQSGGQAPVTYFVTATAPYRVVRVLAGGGQLEMQLAK